MIPIKVRFSAFYVACPHTRGDDPVTKEDIEATVDLSPHAWGMIPNTVGAKIKGKTCPHTRGDDPYFLRVKQKSDCLSPHAWG